MKRIAIILLLLASVFQLNAQYNWARIRRIDTDTVRPYKTGDTVQLIGSFKINGSVLGAVDTSTTVYTQFSTRKLVKDSLSAIHDSIVTKFAIRDTNIFNSKALTTAQLAKKIAYTDTVIGGVVYTQHQVDSILTYNVFDPSKDYEFYEDFDAGVGSSNHSLGRYTWSVQASGVGAGAVLDTTKLGVMGAVRLTAGTGVGNSWEVINTTSDDSPWMGSFAGNEAFTLKMRVKNYDPTIKKKKLFFGLSSIPDPNPQINLFQDGIYFYADSGNYHTVTGVPTAVNTDSTTTKAQTGNWTTFKIISTGSSVGFYIGDTLVSTSVTHIPTNAMKYFAYIVSYEAVTTKIISVDYFWCKMKGLSR